MSSFGQQVANFKVGRDFGIMQAGVESYKVGGKINNVVCRIMPSYVYDEAGEVADTGSWLPFRQNAPPKYMCNDWGCMVYFADYIGHAIPGQKGTTTEIISPITYGDQDCPLTRLFTAAKGHPLFGYLVSRWGGDKGTANSAPLAAPGAHLVCNSIRTSMMATPKVELGIYSQGAADSLFNAKVGLINQLNNLPEEFYVQNYLYRFAAGDLTDPAHGPLLGVSQDATSSFGKYMFTLVRTAEGRLQPWDISAMLPYRYNLKHPERWLRQQSKQEIVTELCRVFRCLSPVDRSTHELDFLREVFGREYEVPETPKSSGTIVAPEGGTGLQAAPTAVSMVGAYTQGAPQMPHLAPPSQLPPVHAAAGAIRQPAMPPQQPITPLGAPPPQGPAPQVQQPAAAVQYAQPPVAPPPVQQPQYVQPPQGIQPPPVQQPQYVQPPQAIQPPPAQHTPQGVQPLPPPAIGGNPNDASAFLATLGLPPPQ